MPNKLYHQIITFVMFKLFKLLHYKKIHPYLLEDPRIDMVCKTSHGIANIVNHYQTTSQQSDLLSHNLDIGLSVQIYTKNHKVKCKINNQL